MSVGAPISEMINSEPSRWTQLGENVHNYLKMCPNWPLILTQKWLL